MTRSDSRQRWSERHGDAVREAAPEVPEFTGPEQGELWQQIAAIPTTVRPRRSRWKVVVTGAVAVGAVGVTAAATAGAFSAHTGRGPVDAEDAELGGTGERRNHGQTFGSQET